MSLLLPPRDSELREMFEIEDLAAKNWTTLPAAKSSARKMFAADSRKAIRAINFIIMRPSGDIDLISVGPRGGVKVLWKFGLPMGGIAS